jgi:hypothetical protein
MTINHVKVVHAHRAVKLKEPEFIAKKAAEICGAVLLFPGLNVRVQSIGLGFRVWGLLGLHETLRTFAVGCGRPTPQTPKPQAAGGLISSTRGFKLRGLISCSSITIQVRGATYRSCREA